MRKLYIIAYDIHNSRMRRKVQLLLRGYQVQGQKSLFECLLTPEDLAQIKKQLRQNIESDDRIHIISLDPRMSVFCYGVAQHYQHKGFYIV